MRVKRTDPGGMAGDPEEWTVHHQPAAEAFQEDREGILLPTPTGKKVRHLVFRGGLSIFAEESKEEIERRLVELAVSPASNYWMEVTDPKFGETVRLTRAAAEDLLWIGDFWLDMAAFRAEMEQRQLDSRMAVLGVQPGAAPNRAMRRLR